MVQLNASNAGDAAIRVYPLVSHHDRRNMFRLPLRTPSSPNTSSIIINININPSFLPHNRPATPARRSKLQGNPCHFLLILTTCVIARGAGSLRSASHEGLSLLRSKEERTVEATKKARVQNDRLDASLALRQSSIPQDSFHSILQQFGIPHLPAYLHICPPPKRLSLYNLPTLPPLPPRQNPDRPTHIAER